MTSQRPIPGYVEMPPTIAEPVYNEDGFGVGFRIFHPPGVECAFHPVTKMCSCGMSQAEVAVIDATATEQSQDQS
jgi:hypothetical protein